MSSIPAIRVHQWLPEWDEVPTDADKFQSPPPREFFITSIRASQLKSLSDVHQRSASTDTRRENDPYVQRTLEEDRTAEIRRYIHVGYPLSSMGGRAMSDEERRSLRKPGWLPTAIIANIIPEGKERSKLLLDSTDAMKVDSGDSVHVSIQLPQSWTDSGWKPKGAFPLEIIDGQHRLSAFREGEDQDFEVPVVLFDGLDFSWQAYLFWTVNIKPKRINASLAYDLYPLLREQDWLEAGESLSVYRETRAQELVESLWGESRSVWHDRINMLGQTGMKAQRPVTQAAFIRSLTATFVRSFRGQKGLGGLFGGAADRSGFNWPRGQQSAFLVAAWNALADAVYRSDGLSWVQALRQSESGEASFIAPDNARVDPAFVSDKSLLASDQGVRAFHMVLNDLSYLAQIELGLADWEVGDDLESSPDAQFNEALASLEHNSIGDFLRRVGAQLATFDWRNSRAPGLSDAEIDQRKALRGSGGYNVLRERLFSHLAAVADEQIARLAQGAIDARRG